ncbi:low molecular weight phosphotyrosine protein phosphatase-like isoform X1 [Asterias rubens]|uniref:low molecular weight phosphotyrosine protein phosphatase-like isoform X1 n=1 Tax=Asterias rubens TaxID=7604 RepID=UPI00145558D7|nr:low molecular weight phosphotyrosine protein phosphatase-like isoform X1 [Asterias rubens]
MAASANKSVLFVCLGNICRSTMAEAMLKHELKARDVMSEWTVDSAATSTYEIGNEPDDRGNDLLQENGIEKNRHRARQITKQDYTKFHYIFGFDDDNLSILNQRKPAGSTSLVRLLGDLDPQKDRIIVDPYYYDKAAFEKVFVQNKRCLEAFLKEVL